MTNMTSNKTIAILLGILAAFFLTTTFVLNRLMSNDGGSWVWSSAFRFFWMLPFLLLITVGQRKLKHLFMEMKKNLFAWILWSSIGFGVFYAGLTYSAAFAPSWLVAGTWQVTIIAGVLISPFISRESFKNILSIKTFRFLLLILLGIVIMQISQVKSISIKEVILGTLPVIIAAFAYPLGNRKMMQITDGKLNAFQRLLGMTLASLPFWLGLSIYGFATNAPTTTTQISQTLIVGICSGVIATGFFFMATDRVRKDTKSLATVEATQSTIVIFAVLGDIFILKGNSPDIYAIIGIVLVVFGMALQSLKN